MRISPRATSRVSLIVALGLAVAGCIQTDQDYTLNPDGSGKVVYEITMPLTAPGIGAQDDDADPAEKAKDEVRSFLRESEGVEAWSDLSYEVTPEKKLRFKGTAYFRDVTAVHIRGSGDMQGMAPKIEKLAGGAFRVQLKQSDEEAPAAPADAPKPTDAEVQQQIADARAQYGQMKPMMSAMLTGMRATTTFRFPGPVTRAVNMSKPDAQSARVSIEGEKMLKVMDAVMGDDALLRSMVVAGRDINQQGPEESVLNEKLFGTKGPVVAESGASDKARFDYEAEVAAAQAGYEANLKKLGIEAPAVRAAPAKAAGGAFKSVRVIGARLVSEADDERGVRPFNAEEGYTLAIALELDGAAIDADAGELTEAVADTGQNLLPKERFDRTLHFPRLSEDRTIIVIEATMALPPAGSKGLKRVAGTMTYVTAGGTKVAELGMVKLAEGGEGAALGAKVEKAGKSGFDDAQSELELKLEVPVGAVKEVRFFDGGGKPIEMRRSGYFGSDDEVTLSFGKEGALPASAKIEVELYDQLTEHTTAWSLENITLLGRPAE